MNEKSLQPLGEPVRRPLEKEQVLMDHYQLSEVEVTALFLGGWALNMSPSLLYLANC
jgi:hypothetical protein